MSTTDALQWTEIANINRRLFEQEQINIRQQSLIVSEGKNWRDWVVGLRRDVDRIDVNVNELFARHAKLEEMTRKAFEIAESVDNVLLAGLEEVTREAAQIGNFLQAEHGYTPGGPFNTTPTLPDIQLPKLPDFGSFLPGVGTGALIAGGAVLAFLLLTRRR